MSNFSNELIVAMGEALVHACGEGSEFESHQIKRDQMDLENVRRRLFGHWASKISCRHIP